MLEIENINVYYGQIQILTDISLEMREKEIATLVGSNGAGKSTLLKTISGIVKPKSGRIKFCDEDITAANDYEIVNRGLVRIPEGRQLFPSMSVLENLELGALRSDAKSRRNESFEMVFKLFPILKERRKQLAGTLSGGEQQMLAISRGLMALPKLLLLDEPSLGLAPLVVIYVFDTIKSINVSGTTIFLVEQNVYSSLSIASKGWVLEKGEIIMAGKGKDLLNDENIKTAYLGI
jgi:branched-chain amino acid transport system ATP-binding protein